MTIETPIVESSVIASTDVTVGAAGAVTVEPVAVAESPVIASTDVTVGAVTGIQITQYVQLLILLILIIIMIVILASALGSREK
jgi:hypothetical protein